MEITEVIDACGHNNIRLTHKTTFAFTKETWLTKRGDCIVAINASKAAADLHEDFKKAAKLNNAQIMIVIEAGGEKEIVNARGGPGLSFLHHTDLVVRKSKFVCSRTIALKADKAASDLSRTLLKRLQDPHQRAKITFTVKDAN